jgi:hypothetical protein
MSDGPAGFDVDRYLDGVDYPATKADLVGIAQKRNAGLDLIDAIEDLPDRSYESPAQVSEAISGD